MAVSFDPGQVRPFVSPAELSRNLQERTQNNAATNNGLSRDQGAERPNIQSTQQSNLRARGRDEETSERTPRRANNFAREAPNANGQQPQRPVAPGQFLDITV